jgi:hypothetical protein
MYVPLVVVAYLGCVSFEKKSREGSGCKVRKS